MNEERMGILWLPTAMVLVLFIVLLSGHAESGEQHDV